MGPDPCVTRRSGACLDSFSPSTTSGLDNRLRPLFDPLEELPCRPSPALARLEEPLQLCQRGGLSGEQAEQNSGPLADLVSVE